MGISLYNTLDRGAKSRIWSHEGTQPGTRRVPSLIDKKVPEFRENKNMAGKRLLARTVLANLGLFLCLIAGPVAAADLDLTRAQALMKEGKAAEAYALLEPQEFDHAGEIAFDYLLGIAALDSGKPDKATIAFERVLAINPEYAGARLDMARAYFALGDMVRAKQEFETVLSQKPPAAARAVVEKYLSAIEQREKAKLTRLTGYLEGTAGYDSNVNFSTAQTQVNVPALGNLPFTLAAGNVKASAAFGQVGGGVDYGHDFTPKFGIYAGADARARAYDGQSDFSYNNIDARAGVSIGAADNQLRVGVLGGENHVNIAGGRSTAGVNGDWRYNFNPTNQLNVFSQFSSIRFKNDQLKVNDFNLTTSGVGWLHVLGDGRSALTAAAFFGEESSAGDRADGNAEFQGLRLAAQYSLREKLDVFASVGAQFKRYSKENAAFQATRHDDIFDGALGVNWRFAEFWLLRPQVTYTEDRSNITLNRYDRTEASITLRRDF